MSSEQLQGFFESTAGQISTLIVIILLFLGILISGRNSKPDTKAMVVSAIMVALAIALNQIILFRMPQGGSITAFSMLPIVTCAYFFGVRRGMMAGMCVGLIDLIFNPYVIHPIQMLLDYPLAFGALAFAGLMKNKKNGLILGFIIGVLSRYVCAVLSGVIFFGEYAPEGFNAFSWSIYYNMTYLGVEAAITLIVLFIPAVRKVIEGLKSQLSLT
ncbi:energy-coupled thiamine transporter ThiT [Sinanaerobacter chloroacetimidivorans]|uniref:Energy-coupled thiamine transporter ThiT n=1 Tax=Sinanaerobacter chloroacetimidivorans TaxID=2818044 RepID=A0A8J7W6U0_9FIRM|nr:energy-coupled thiamine transporter ThiT [Sinanaerobacter chloroacetimidivorans]MBR0600153.1 energy-coupled thiamine transporter ThiT [Sinanaerobacter chloroacetimidivorans]